MLNLELQCLWQVCEYFCDLRNLGNTKRFLVLQLVYNFNVSSTKLTSNLGTQTIHKQEIKKQKENWNSHESGKNVNVQFLPILMDRTFHFLPTDFK